MQRYNKKMGYANKSGFFLEFPEYPDRYADPEADDIRTNRQSQKQHRR